MSTNDKGEGSFLDGLKNVKFTNNEEEATDSTSQDKVFYQLSKYILTISQVFSSKRKKNIFIPAKRRMLE